jgi:poly-beta-1,6-N-acetyl-D-glucosamine synthase
MAAFIFYTALLLLIYTYAGYPLFVALWAKLRPRPIQRGTSTPAVAIVVVVHNEQARIRAKIDTCLAQDYPAHLLRIVVVSDGSTDTTAAQVQACTDPRVTWMPCPQRRGKAACLNDALAACTEEIVVLTDARQMLNTQAVRYLVENLSDNTVGAVSGELMLVQDDMTSFSEGVDAYWRYEKFIRQKEAALHSAPGVTGALYAIRRSCFIPIAANTILDDVAIPMQAVRAGYRVVFDSRAHAYDRPSQSAAQERARKVRTLAGNYQLLAMMPWLVLPWANPIWVQFMSHKILRLVAPFAMLALLLAHMVLAIGSAGYALLLVAHILGYCLALWGQKIPSLAHMRLIKLASAFVLLNSYAVLGLWQFLCGREGHLWQMHVDQSKG